MHFCCACEFGLGGEGSGELTEHLIVGAAESLDARIVGAFEDALEVINGSLAVGCVGADGVVGFIGQDGDGGGFEPAVFEELSNAFEMIGVAHIEDGNLHAVITCGFEFFDGGIGVLGDVTGPEQQVESNFNEGRV